MNVYRIQQDKHRDTILTGEGARLYGGRWNIVGHALVYTSSSMELALLETIVHFDATPPDDLPPYIVATIDIPNSLITYLDIDDLPKGWQLYDDYPAEELDAFLQEKFRQTNSLALAIPSVILPQSNSRNILLNPVHPKMSEVSVLDINILPIHPKLA